jgi:hypothetical protein
MLEWSIVIAAIAIMAIRYALDRRKEEKERQRKQRREEIYLDWHTCTWCRREYQVRGGNTTWCSPKCEHEQTKAWRNAE